MAITILDPKNVLLDDTVDVLMFKGSHLCFIDTEIVSGRNKDESVSIHATKWKFSASGYCGLRDNGQHVTRTAFDHGGLYLSEAVVIRGYIFSL